jgi:ribosomal protein S20
MALARCNKCDFVWQERTRDEECPICQLQKTQAEKKQKQICINNLRNVLRELSNDYESIFITLTAAQQAGTYYRERSVFAESRLRTLAKRCRAQLEAYAQLGIDKRYINGELLAASKEALEAADGNFVTQDEFYSIQTEESSDGE